MSLVLQSSGGGSITIQEPATASNFTQTLPAATGEVMVSGNQPAFSAYASVAQALGTNTFVKIVLNVESFDTNNNFDAVTNYRFTPTVAGYYQVNGFVSNNAVVTVIPFIYKNGSVITTGSISQGSTNNGNNGGVVCDLIFMNGTTDYIEFYAISIGSSSNTGAGVSGTKMSAVMVRSA
jgi:hypothetical protein